VNARSKGKLIIDDEEKLEWGDKITVTDLDFAKSVCKKSCSFNFFLDLDVRTLIKSPILRLYQLDYKHG
jgi:hypothetical protein